MDDPVAAEFEMTFGDINYGNDVRKAMLGLLGRMPSVTVMALVTSILVQKETGGNLAEILENISNVIRGRFKFQRKVKTYTAEGRMSAWVLAMVPLVLFVILWVVTPDYLPVLLDDPRGQELNAGDSYLLLRPDRVAMQDPQDPANRRIRSWKHYSTCSIATWATRSSCVVSSSD